MNDSTPSTRQLVALVALVALVLTAGCVLYALTPAGSRVGFVEWLKTSGPGAGALIVALLGWFGVRRANATQETHTEQLAQITHQTNGVLSKRISDVVEAALDARGLTVTPVPQQRTAKPRAKARTKESTHA